MSSSSSSSNSSDKLPPLPDTIPPEPVRDPRIIGHQPLAVDQFIRMEKGGDCLPCKIVGSVAFMGLGGYTYFAGMKNLNANAAAIAASNTRWGIGVRRLAITGLAGSMVAAGFLRLVTFKWFRW